MRSLIETADPVLLSFAEAVLKDAGIECRILDANISAVEGSIGILPRRLCVAEALVRPARQVLEDAGLGGDLRPA